MNQIFSSGLTLLDALCQALGIDPKGAASKLVIEVSLDGVPTVSFNQLIEDDKTKSICEAVAAEREIAKRLLVVCPRCACHFGVPLP